MAPIVETTAGRVEGEQRATHARFLGVPFAAPPLGALRFRAPQPVAPWTGVRAATAYGLAAPQAAARLPGMAVGAQGEDCLTLNVFTPAADARRRPVFFWIHGGGFTAGGSGQPLYDGAALAERGDVVVVTINYRLGALGYLHLPDVEKNLGQRDQVAALRWVRGNVARFGGDPENVTIAGESAGGMAVTTLLAMPSARGLFRRAIAQSGAAHMTHSVASAERITATFAAKLGIDPRDLEALRAFPVDALLRAQTATALEHAREFLPFAPVVDPDTVPVHPLEAVRRGDARDVAVMTGTTRDEVKLFRVGPPPRPLDDDGLVKRVRAGLRVSRASEGHAERLIEVYKKARPADSDLNELFDAYDTDRTFRIPAIRLAEAQRAHRPDTYLYLFSWCSPAQRGALGACHALELPFMFGTLSAPTMDRFAGKGPAAEALSAAMMETWLAFTRGGNPECELVPRWPGYDLGSRPTLIFDRTCALVADPYGIERRGWDGVI